ncbi:MAG: protein kinase [Acidobacteria bacterium]|nr:protein kinase [Acidobacteriota bacterium]
MMTLNPGSSIGPYEILKLLGAGGMGDVYRAHDRRLGRDVAIKVLPERLSESAEVRMRFEREARSISQFNHPHICSLYDVGHHENIDYLVMEYLEGETLAVRIDKGPLPPDEVLRFAIEIVSALDCAHRGGIVHRDLKPGNIMLSKSGAKLMDFGLAHTRGLPPAAGMTSESPTASQPLTAAGTIVGTFQYMAPEQLEGKEADPRADLWAFGCLLYEMATGKKAFAGSSHASLIAAILKEAPRPMSDLQPLTPPALERIARRCLEKDPDERFQSARDLAFALENVSGTAAPSTIAAAKTFSGKRRIAAVLAGVLLCAALLAAGFFVAAHWKESRQEAPNFSRLTFQRGRVGNARFTPDGKSVIYSAAWDGLPSEVFETRTDLSTTRSLNLPGNTLQSVSRAGELALKQQELFTYGYGALATAPLSGSAPRNRLDGISCADWSPDGIALAVVRRAGGEDVLEMPSGQVLARTSGVFSDVRISPDGRRIAFAQHPIMNDTRGSVVAVDASGSKKILTSEFSGVQGLAWSPDGREIWFSAVEKGIRQSLFAVTLEGRLRKVAQFPADNILCDIAPDGRVLLVSRRTQIGIRGSSAPDVPERDLGWLDSPWPRALSADGKMLLLDDMGETTGAIYTVYLRNMDGSLPVQLGKGAACAISPDGRSALVIHYGLPHQLMLIPTGSGNTIHLPRGKVETYQTASFFPDGRRIVFIGAERGRPQRT